MNKKTIQSVFPWNGSVADVSANLALSCLQFYGFCDHWQIWKFYSEELCLSVSFRRP